MKPQRLAPLALLCTAISPYAGAQAQDWIQQLGTSDNDGVRAAAQDGSGGLYLCGGTTGSLGGPSAGEVDAWIGRYDGAGIQIWTRQLGSSVGDSASSAAADGAGGVYVTGYTLGSLGGPHEGSADVWLARFDGAGNQTWIRQLGTSEFDRTEGAASDGAGGVYVTGSTYGSLGGPSAGNVDSWLAHYDGAGNQTWIRQFGTAGFNHANSAAPDGAGGVYISGDTNGIFGGPSAGGNDAWLARYDAAGNQIWIRKWGTLQLDQARAAAPDGSGGVYLTGVTYGNLEGFSIGTADAWLTRFDSAGNQAWIRQLGSGRAEYGVLAASNGVGGVIVGGSTNGDLGGTNAGRDDAWLASYDEAGNQTWIQQLGTSTHDRAAAAAPVGGGGVFLAGTTNGGLGGPSEGGSDAWVARYESLDTVRYCSPAIPNSTGQPGVIAAVGSSLVVLNDLTVVASQLPPMTFGIFLTSRDQGLVIGSGGSQGNLCLGDPIGRFDAPGQIMSSGATGSFELRLDLGMLPTPTGPVAGQPGETWNLQAWYRDANPGSTSNFTDAVSVTLQ